MLTVHRKTLVTIFFIAILGVLTHWNVWSDGVYAVGFNTSVYWIGIWYLLLNQSSASSFRRDWLWLLPLWLIVISFSLYENPWLKLISLICLPLVTGIFYAYGQLDNRRCLHWNSSFLVYLLGKALSPLAYLLEAKKSYQTVLFDSFEPQYKSISRRVLKGLLLLIPAASFVLFLLVSADENFSTLVGTFFSNFFAFIQFETAAKLIFIIVSSILLLAMLYGWRRESSYLENINDTKIDDIVASIVIGGILIIYLTFLYLQLEYLWVKTLPVNFSQVEHLVKSGFWQLFFLSILNVILFFYTYKKTGETGQIILRIFIIASGLILVSACWRMGMYVYWYGLSYEKFFASYTAIYALFIFVFLLVATFSVSRKNILCFVAFSSLWFYSIASVLPIEKIIFNTNYALSKQVNSRVDLLHLRALSLDVYGDVKKSIVSRDFDARIWRAWVFNIENNRCQRKWYETNLSMLFNCPSL